MKKSLFVAAFAALALVACDKTATKEKVDAVDSTVNANVDSANVALDSAKVKMDSTATKVEKKQMN
jgi:ribosomal protein L12E/L44/L45/RPP1/RPP2